MSKNNWLEAKREREKIEAAGKVALSIHAPQLNGLNLEEVVLGECLVDPQVAKDALELLNPNCFQDEANKAIFKAFQALRAKSQGIDPMTVSLTLNGQDLDPKLFGQHGAAYYLIELCNRIGSTANAEYHCQMLLEIELKRNLNAAAFEVIQAAKDPNLAAFDVLDLAKSRINEAEQRRDKVLGKDFDLKAYVLDNLDGFKEQGFDVSSFLGKQAAEKLDLLGENEVTVIAGRPGSGKTSFGLQVAVEAALAGRNTVFVSYEMTAQRVYARAICQMAEVPFTDWKKGRLSQEQKARILAATERLMAAPFKVLDLSGQDVNAMAYKLLELHRERPIEMLAIDYLGIVADPPNKNFFNETERNTYNSGRVRLLTKKLLCPTLLLVQMSRASDKDGYRLPQMSDLRDSGAIEQDAHRVVFIHRHEYFGILEYDKTEATEDGESTAGKALLIVRKNRDSEVGIAKIAFQGLYTKFAPAETFDFSQIQAMPTFAPRVPKEANFDDNVPF
jgi:replicative DNA helicase